MQVVLPGVTSLADLVVELSDTALAVEGGGYSLSKRLEFAVDSTAASAKFSSKTSTLKIKAVELGGATPR